MEANNPQLALLNTEYEDIPHRISVVENYDTGPDNQPIDSRDVKTPIESITCVESCKTLEHLGVGYESVRYCTIHQNATIHRQSDNGIRAQDDEVCTN